MIMLGPGLFFGGSSTLSLSRAICGTKTNRLEGSVAIACAPGGRGRTPRRAAALVKGAKEVFAGAVGGHEGRRMFLRDRPQQRQRPGALVDREAGDRRRGAPPDIEPALIGADRQPRRSARH